MTISDAFGGSPAAAASPAAPTVRLEKAHPHARMRAREYGSRSVMVNTFAGWGRQTWSDLREAWWTPAALPTFQTAWAQRMPDRDRIPGNSNTLYWGWAVYNHTVGLAVPLAAVVLVGVITPILWIVAHPARLLLAAVIITALVGLAVN